MVENPGKKTGPGRIRPLNRPEPVRVNEDDDGGPSAIVAHGRRAGVASIIEDVWEIVDEWWRPSPIARRYYRVVLQGGAAVTLFHDLANGAWYKQGA